MWHRCMSRVKVIGVGAFQTYTARFRSRHVVYVHKFVIHVCGCMSRCLSRMCLAVGQRVISGAMSRSLVFLQFNHVRHAFNRGMWHGCISFVTHMCVCRVRVFFWCHVKVIGVGEFQIYTARIGSRHVALVHKFCHTDVCV